MSPPTRYKLSDPRLELQICPLTLRVSEHLAHQLRVYVFPSTRVYVVDGAFKLKSVYSPPLLPEVMLISNIKSPGFLIGEVLTLAKIVPSTPQLLFGTAWSATNATFKTGSLCMFVVGSSLGSSKV